MKKREEKVGPPALRNQPRPSDLLHKPFFCRLVRSPGDGAEGKLLLLYGCLQNSNSFDSAQSEVSGGARELGGTADVSRPRPQTDTEVGRLVAILRRPETPLGR